VIGSRRRLAALFLLALVVAVALLPGGGPPLGVVLTDVAALLAPGRTGDWIEASRPRLLEREAAPRSGRAPPPTA
jgi:hypothetical protein